MVSEVLASSECAQVQSNRCWAQGLQLLQTLCDGFWVDRPHLQSFIREMQSNSFFVHSSQHACSQATKFLLNALVLPLGLQGLVFATWRFRDATLLSCGAATRAKSTRHKAPQTLDVESAAELERETVASRFGDHYFALFLTCRFKCSLLCRLCALANTACAQTQQWHRHSSTTSGAASSPRSCGSSMRTIPSRASPRTRPASGGGWRHSPVWVWSLSSVSL
eukprot:COSAG04_NODE_341_length_16294_cov_8.682618_15_plen_222_part_00